MFNQFLDRNHTRFTRGLACRGLQIYCPISPRFSLLLYDRDLYKVGSLGCRCVEISPAEVHNFNTLEYLYARENIYFSQEADADRIRTISNRYYTFRQSGAGRLVRGKETRLKAQAELVTLEANRPKFFPELTSVKIKRRVNKTQITGVRDENWTTIVRDFAAAVDRGEANDFPTFVMSHRLASLVRSFST
jgi:hypothetical protein